MKNKFIIFLILFIFFTPVVSRAMRVPMFNLTIIVNTQGSDSSFNFNLKSAYYDCSDQDNPCIKKFKDYQDFSLQTGNLTASKLENLSLNDYSIEEENISGLKINNIICTSDNPSDVFWYQPAYVNFSPGVNENIVCTFDNVESQTKVPVLIVPGILGTEIKNGNETLWLDLGRMLTDIGDSFLDVLSFNTNLVPVSPSIFVDDVIGSKTVGPFKFDYTDGLINEFKNQGYVEDQNLFTFPYDWRYGASGKFADPSNPSGQATNVDLLKKKIQDILTQTGSDKVDVVAHSLGGLIVKKYAMDNPTNNHIGKAVFVGVPNTGAPKAAKALLQGDSFGIPWLSQDEMKKIAANIPAVYDLLPTQKYYDTKGSFIETVSPAGLFGFTEKYLNYNESKDFLTGEHFLNSTALAGSESLHTQNFDDFDLRSSGVDLYAIDGCKAGTLSQLAEVKYKDLLGKDQITYATPTETPGDGTVPLESSTNLPIDANNKYYALVSDHGKMPSQDGIRQEVVNLISGSSLDVAGNLITQDIGKCNLNGKAISVFSPVDIFVTDQNGNKLGLANDGSIINEIPNADFEILGDSASANASADKHKFLYLPQDNGQIYSISMQGTNTGTYTIKSQDIQNNQTTKTEVFSNLPVTANLTGQINIGAGDATTLSVKQNSNDTITTILPSATLDASTSEDLLPPVSTATLVGTAGQAGFYRSDVSVNLKAIDDLSGVLDVGYNLDNAGYQKISDDTATVLISKEGKHTIAFFSTDKAGNNEQEQTITFTIDKTAPEAVIQFDQNAKDLNFTGADNISDATSILVQDKDDTITLIDQAGNTTVINLKNKNRKISMTAEIKSLKYNGVSADISKNLMAFLWLFDKKKNLSMLSQHIQTKKGYNILAVYDGNKTSFLGKDANGLISKSLSGLKIIRITTNKGDLSWSY